MMYQLKSSIYLSIPRHKITVVLQESQKITEKIPMTPKPKNFFCAISVYSHVRVCIFKIPISNYKKAQQKYPRSFIGFILLFSVSNLNIILWYLKLF